MKSVFKYFLILIFAGNLHCSYDRIDDAIPAPDFNFSPATQIGIDQDITFTASADFAIQSYFWEFGDGGSSAEASPVWVYDKGGRYTVKLTLTAKGGETFSAEKKLFIDPFKNNMNPIPGGTFLMGCNFPTDEDCDPVLEHPQHQVTLAPFFLGATEVTQEAWQAITGENPSFFGGCPDCPVELVTWDQVHAFIDTLNSLSGFAYYLPSEAQWEYAARAGGTTEVYSGGNGLHLVGWYGSPTGSTHPVGTLAPNAWSLFDMSGNVFEWCEDDFHGDYNGAPADGSPWVDASPSALKVIRGGAWSHPELDCRLSARMLNQPKNAGSNFVGFRLARN